MCVVESEKSALVLTLAFPEKLFIATGGKNNLKGVDDRMLLYPDMDAIEYWSSIKGARICEWRLRYDTSEEHGDYAEEKKKNTPRFVVST